MSLVSDPWLWWQRKLKESSITKLSMYSLFECIFSARITSLIHISIDLLYIRCPGTHEPAWGIAQHDSKKYGLDSSIWQNSSDWPQICWLWLSVDGVGRPSLIAFQDNKEMTLNPLWRMRQKKRIVNVLNLHCPPIRNNDNYIQADGLTTHIHTSRRLCYEDVSSCFLD